MAITPEQLDNWFRYHPPKDADTSAKYEALRAVGKVFAEKIVELTPSSADQTTAVRKVREAVFTANAAIACEGK